ncbi:MAG: hypothetical protein HC905_28190, partial [Bacteroidales bacterium]|nr:hypothetical protein [Bacteroidales bacterium]
MNEQTGAAIAAILNGNATDGDKELVNQWIKEHPDDLKILDLLKDRSFHISTGNGEQFREKIFDRVQVKIAATESRRTIRLWQWVAAASVALLISVSAYFIVTTSSQPQHIIETKCPEGSRSTITLADGTKVELNSGSSISYPSRFTGKQRQVELSGEAFFDVTADKKKPFVVKAGGISIRVLGTHFNVKAYENEKQVFTTLLKGSVRIEIPSAKEQFFVLKPKP